jgi:hypothetical protein
MTETSPLDRFIIALQNESILSHQPIVVERFKQLLQAHTELAHPGGVTSYSVKPSAPVPEAVQQLERTKAALIAEGGENG